jgi:hypothetical protein
LSRVLPGRALDPPVAVGLPWIDRASIPAPHRDDDVRRADDLVRHWLRELVRDIDTDLLHRRDDVGSAARERSCSRFTTPTAARV